MAWSSGFAFSQGIYEIKPSRFGVVKFWNTAIRGYRKSALAASLC